MSGETAQLNDLSAWQGELWNVEPSAGEVHAYGNFDHRFSLA
jgi:hypothetical protein